MKLMRILKMTGSAGMREAGAGEKTEGGEKREELY